MSSKPQIVKLDDLVTGKLPERVVNAVTETYLTVNEVMEWEQSKPEFHMTFTEGYLRISVRKQYSLKKLFAILGSIVATLWAIVQFAIPYITH